MQGVRHFRVRRRCCRRVITRRRVRSPSSTSMGPRMTVSLFERPTQRRPLGQGGRLHRHSRRNHNNMGSTKCVTNQTCNAGTEVTFCTVTGMGHCWPEVKCGPGAGPCTVSLTSKPVR
jgi:hypothetical protein